MQYHGQGATGIYAFNWHADRDSKRELLTQVGAVQTLRRQDKLYNATHRFRQHTGEWRGAYQHDRLRGTVPVPLYPTMRESGPHFDLDLADDLSADPPATITLRLRLQDWVAGDQIRCCWDGDGISRPRYHLLPRRRSPTYLRCQRRRLAQLRAHSRPSRPRSPSPRRRPLATPPPTCLRLAADRCRGINPL